MIRTVTNIGPYKPKFIDNGPKKPHCIFLPLANKKVHVFCHLRKDNKNILGEIIAHDNKDIWYWVCRGSKVEYRRYKIGELVFKFLRDENLPFINANLQDLVMNSIQQDLDLAGSDIIIYQDSMFVEGDTVDMVPEFKGAVYEHI